MHNTKVGIGVLIFDNRNRLLLGLRTGKHGALSWGPPGGNLEYGETFEECAIREVEEETGLTIDIPTFFAITNDLFSENDKHYISIFMQTHYRGSEDPLIKEADKVIEWKWFDLQNLPENLFLPLVNLLTNQGYGLQLNGVSHVK